MTDTMHHSTAELIRRVRAEFLEMPGLRLTSDQARRLWGLDARTCQWLLCALVDTHFLKRTADGRYRRVET